MTDDTRWLDEMMPAAARASLTDALAKAAREGVAALPLRSGAMVNRSIERFAKSALHVDVLALFAQGWSTDEQIYTFANAAPGGSSRAAVARLGAHHISREFTPEVIVHYGGMAHRVPLKAGIRIRGGFDGVELGIEDRHITAVGSGRCDLTVEPELAGASFGEPITIRKWVLPGRHEFTPPVPIGRSR